MSNEKTTEKLYCYVDETGQETLGRVFIVAVIIAKSDKEELVELLHRIEQETGKKGTKWLKTMRYRKVEYMERIVRNKRFKGVIYYSQTGGTTSYPKITIRTISAAVKAAKSQDKYKASVYIDGLHRAEWRKTGTELRHLGIATEKVRGVRDESYAMVRLADAVAGLIREKGEGRDYAIELFNIGVSNDTLKEVQ